MNNFFYTEAKCQW